MAFRYCDVLPKASYSDILKLVSTRTLCVNLKNDIVKFGGTAILQTPSPIVYKKARCLSSTDFFFPDHYPHLKCNITHLINTNHRESTLPITMPNNSSTSSGKAPADKGSSNKKHQTGTVDGKNRATTASGGSGSGSGNGKSVDNKRGSITETYRSEMKDSTGKVEHWQKQLGHNSNGPFQSGSPPPSDNGRLIDDAGVYNGPSDDGWGTTSDDGWGTRSEASDDGWGTKSEASDDGWGTRSETSDAVSDTQSEIRYAGDGSDYGRYPDDNSNSGRVRRQQRRR
jgi:hypothetical protein